MLINSLSRADAARSASNANYTSSAASFSAALDAATMRVAQNADAPTRTLSTAPLDGGAPTKVYRSEAARELAEYADKSVAERVRDAILKDMGLTEDDLKAMDPEKRAAIEDEIARRMKAILAGDYDSATALKPRVNPDPADALVSELTNALANGQPLA
jgi:hypothetical protein